MRRFGFGLWGSVSMLAFGVLGCSRGVAAPRPTSTPLRVSVPLGLPAEIPIPPGNPLTIEKVELGRLLYFDPRLSADGTISCASCHDPARGFADPGPVSTGIRGQKGGRNAPTVLNRAYGDLEFWDGRASSLEEQAGGPIQNPVEMGFTAPGAAERVQGIPGYRERFRQVFGTETVSFAEVTSAIAAFERTLLSGNAPYDRFQGGDRKALSESAQRGLLLFNGKALCVACHFGPNFTDEKFHNLGVGQKAKNPDPGRFAVTHREEDRGAFKTPTLRDVARTSPYMHDGSRKSLEAVIDLYDAGGEPSPRLDPLIHPLRLSAGEKGDLVAFLEALTGEVPPVSPPAELPK